MRLPIITRIIGILLLFFSITLLPPLAIALYTQDGEAWHFTQSILLVAAAGLLLWYPTHRQRGSLHNREAFLIVVMFWFMFGALGSVPLILGAHLNVTDAVFEAVSGVSTTGATVILGIDNLPPSILMYRQQLCWLGGLGVIVFAIAILPMLGVGGMQLYRIETPNPMKDESLTPRIGQTARTISIIYLLLTLMCAISYWLAGMSLFDAVAHSFSTLSTAGFSTHDASIAYFNNPAVEIVGMIFMLAGATSFSVHYLAMHGRGPAAYWRDTQARVFLCVVAVLVLVVSLCLYFGKQYTGPLQALRYGAFQLITMITTTGLTTADFSSWPLGTPLLLMFSTIVAGCAGSTSGGIKIIRFIVLAKVGQRELMRLIHPQMVRPIKISGRVLPKPVLDAVWSFFSVYVAVFIVLLLLVMATGVDQVTAFGAITTCINGTGPGLGVVAITFHDINPVAKWLCSLAMLLGRLEIFPLLVLFSPVYWRR